MQDREYIIYCFLDENNKPYYVGQTYNLKMRLNAHNQFILDIEEKRLPSKYPYYRKARDLFKNGIGLKVNILENNLTKKEADLKESEYISKFRNDISCKLLNILAGGEFNQRNKFVSDETKKKISESKKGKKLTEKHKESLRNCDRKQRNWTEEDKIKYAKMAKINLLNKQTPESIEKMRQSKVGQKHSEETKSKIARFGKDHKRAKHYLIIAPDGTNYDIHGLSSFCKEFDLNQSGLWHALNKGNGKYKGWQIQEL
jgi:group I intron endonuclease